VSPPAGRGRKKKASAKASTEESTKNSTKKSAEKSVKKSKTWQEKTLFTLEMKSRDHFELRAEKYDSELKGSEGVPALLSSDVSADIKTWPGATLDYSTGYTSFPMDVYSDTLSRLTDKGWMVDPVPDFVLSLALAASRPDSRDEAINQETSDRVLAKFGSVLMPYQAQGVEFALNQARGRVLFGDEMGLGKTLQALVMATFYKEDWPILVICPATLRYVWKEQAERWLPETFGEGRVQVVDKGSQNLSTDARMWVVSYRMVAHSKCGKFSKRPDGRPHNFVIVDESHKIKEWSTRQTKVAVEILQASRHVALLSGTPSRNYPHELHPQLSGLQVAGLPEFDDFKKRYCLEKLVKVLRKRPFKKPFKARNTQELNLALTSCLMIRRLKKDVLKQLPAKRRQRIPIMPANTKLVNEVKEDMKNMQKSNGGPGKSVSEIFSKMAIAKLPEVKEYVLDSLDRTTEKTIIFGHHHEMLDGIEGVVQKRLKQDGLTYIRIDGSTPMNKRAQMVKRFQEEDECRVAVLSITACGEGLTLSAASLVIFAELYWVPGALEQAEARAHRIGSTHSKVLVEFLVVPGSVDDMIFAMLKRKKRGLSQVLDNVEEEFTARIVTAWQSPAAEAAEEAPPPPPRPPSARELFREAIAEELPGRGDDEVSETADALWKTMGDAEINTWEEQAEQAKARYDKDLEIYTDRYGRVAAMADAAEAAAPPKSPRRAGAEAEPPPKKLRGKKKVAEVAPLEEAAQPEKPKKPRKGKRKPDEIAQPQPPEKPPSAFMIFHDGIVEQYPKSTANVVLKKAKKLWEALGEVGTKHWGAQAEQAMDSYEKELEAYTARYGEPGGSGSA